MDLLNECSISAAMEDYLEAILSLMASGQRSVRVTDIAEKLSIAKPSVTQALGVLKEMGLVEQERYGRVYLTAEGMKAAASVSQRHRVLREFLVEVLGVDPSTADKDACQMEHAVSPATMERLVNWLRNWLEENRDAR
ncbi:MAG: metal-dependent transcriptional regulator [Firmicutes bacterium]|nr:metal-dependent transcriptional regulator [Candidatus Fermentithermobacillaceae bacterium]